MSRELSLADLVNQAKLYTVTDDDINTLQERLEKFEKENKPLTIDYNLVYTM